MDEASNLLFQWGVVQELFNQVLKKDKLIVCPGFRFIINILVTVPRAQEACVCNSSVSAAVRPVRHLLDTLPVPTTLVIL